MKKIFVFFLLAGIPFLLAANQHTYQRVLDWRRLQTVSISQDESVDILRFAGSVNESGNAFAPYFYEVFSLPDGTVDFQARLRSVIYETAPANEQAYLKEILDDLEEIQVLQSLGTDRKRPVAAVSFMPLRLNTVTGLYEKVVRFSLEIIPVLSPDPAGSLKAGKAKQNSVLESGDWYRIAVQNTGIYKLTYDDLSAMGIPVASINPKDIRLYGLRGGMLPENLQRFRYDGLQQAAIHVEGEEDGVFNSGDYVLFYGQSPDSWEYSYEYNLLEKHLHLYDDYTYYFITVDLGEGKRIPAVPSSGETPNSAAISI